MIQHSEKFYVAMTRAMRREPNSGIVANRLIANPRFPWLVRKDWSKLVDLINETRRLDAVADNG